MNISEQTVRSMLPLRDGLNVTLYHFTPHDLSLQSRPSVLLVHGYAEHMGRYARLVEYLHQLGFDVWGYDARGHGTSEGTRGAIPTNDALVNDLVEVFHHVERLTAQKPTIIAHSMGGLTAALAVTQKGLKPAALVLSSPALRIPLTTAQKFQLKVGMLLPNLVISPPAVDSSLLSHDPAIGAAYRSDPLVHQKISPRLANYMAAGGDAVRAKAAAFTMPTFLMYAGDDHIVDPSGADDLAALWTQKNTQALRYDGAYHEILSESEPMRCEILADLTTWLKKREFMPKFP